METLALASVGKSTQSHYLGKWNIWVAERAAQGKEPWLNQNPDDPNQALTELMEFMACHCYVQNNQRSTVREYFAAIKLLHKMYTGRELPTSHCMIAAVGKRIDRAYGMLQKKAQVRLPLTWPLFMSQGRRVVVGMSDGGNVMWLSLARSYFLLCRASEL